MKLCTYHKDSLGFDTCSEGQQSKCMYLAARWIAKNPDKQIERNPYLSGYHASRKGVWYGQKIQKPAR